MSQHSRILLGAMSGTSADGVDVAAVEIAGRGLAMQAKYLGHIEHPYDAELRRRIFELRESGSCRLDELAKLGRDITLAYADATRELMTGMSLDPRSVAGLAAHGQTLYHAPPDSIQWLDPSLLAARTQLVVISDFRRADLAAGGQGAPLVPFADWILFRHPEKTRVILNIGGIANLTYLPAGGGVEDVIAFDTGPGNCWSDWLLRQHDPGGPVFDEGGRRALEGRPSFRLGEWILQQEYFRRAPPKSTDVSAMIDLLKSAPVSVWPWFGKRRADEELAMTDELAELADAVGRIISAAVQLLPTEVDELVAAGGGAKNNAILHWIGWHTPRSHPEGRIWIDRGWADGLTTDELGVPSQAREAVAFAILGAATLDGEPSNVPSATGASKRVVLGSITPRPGM